MGGRLVLQVSLLTLVMTFRHAGCFSQTHVPVAIWSNERHSIFPEALAGHNINEDTFSRKYLGQILGSNTSVVVFIQEQMSAQDITDTIDQEDGTFTHLTNLLDSYPSTYLPNVESATLALERMGGLGSRKVFQLTPPFQLPEYLTANPMQSLFLVDIPTTSSSMPFQSADEIIGSVTGLLEQMEIPYTAIYTATHPSSRDRTDDFTGHVGRRILQVDGSNDYTFVNISNCLYFYAENISLMINGNSFLLGNPVLGNNSYCANYTALMSLVYDNPAAGLQTATLDMHFACTTGLNVGYWYMSNFSIGYTMVNSTTNQTESNTTAMFPYFVTETPFGFSYSCSYLPQIPEMEFIDTGTRYVNITFTKFQVQAFYITYDSFGYYNDCVGFFTITIWAVLITLAFMFGILTFGICIMTSLETGDRTDDPKGKQIVVNTVD